LLGEHALFQGKLFVMGQVLHAAAAAAAACAHGAGRRSSLALNTRSVRASTTLPWVPSTRASTSSPASAP
jgi:hypothetical protein